MDVFGGAPRFLAYPRPVVVQSGTDAVLKCQIGGDPRPAVIWERNNEKIHPEGRYRVFEDGNVYNLIISAVNTEDSGQYICKAKNSIGETYAAATLKVEGEAQEMEFREENKPRFLIKPLSTRVGRGEDAVFSCKLWGNPKPEVIWEKDGKKLNEIFESTHFNVGYQDGGWFQLKIFKARAPDGGVYTCKARNEFGESLAGAVLLVDAGPGHEEEVNRNGYTNGHWKAHPGKQRCGRQVLNRLRDDSPSKSTKVKMFAVTEGKHAKFRCFVTGKPKPEIIWRKDGRLILSGRRYLLYEDREGYFTLKVLYCKQKDNGVYVCAASNTAGQTLSAVHLSVKEPLVRFKQPLIDLEVWERDLAILECEVPEDSVPITWYLEDRRLQPGAKYGMEEWGTKRRLTIRDIGVDDDGIYLCEMPDGGRSIAEVAVKGTIMRKLPRKVDVLEGENAAFCVEVEKEEMDIHWYKEGIELRETHQTILKSFGRTHILVFVNTMPQDSGLVTFLVGRSKTSSQLRVKSARHCPPSCPVGVQINTERANAALLSWVPPQDTRKNPPSGYVLERQEVGTGSQEWLQCLTTDSATSVEILGDSVPCEADYRFRICSVNKYGKSNNVEFPKTVHLVPVARIQAPLQDALVPEGQDALFSIELSSSVIGTWFLNGTQLQEDERFSMRRSRSHQSLRIRGVRDIENGAEITFIAYGIRDSAALYIQAPLVKFSHLSEMDRNKFVEIGNPIVLYCELSDPAAPVHWYKNGVELQTMEGLHIQSEGTMRRIVIQSAEFSHSGVYCCDAIDDVIRFNVEVEAPPVKFSAILDAEHNKTVQTGCPIVLRCKLSDASAQVYWYKDGSKLHPQSGLDLISEGFERKLIVDSAELFHSGLYCCKTKSDSITFSVDIQVPPMKFAHIPEEMRTKSIEAGCPLVLQCVVSPSEAEVAWYKDEILLISNSGLEIQSDGDVRKLVIQSTELHHSGVYRCTTQDDAVEFQVDIKALPVTHSAMLERTKSFEVGKPLELECEVADTSVPVCWYKDGRKLLIQNGWDVQSSGMTRKLIIPSAELLHSGLYSCETSGGTIHFTVDIEAPMLVPPPSAEVVEMKALEGPCPTEPACKPSDPDFQVSWQENRDIDSIKEADFENEGVKMSLVVEPNHSSNSGSYYSATVDDVAQLIVPPPTSLLEPDFEKAISAEARCPIVQQFEISDPVAKACWYKDGTLIYPKREADCQSQCSSKIKPNQSQYVSNDGTIGCDTSVDAHLNEDIKAEQCHYADEIGEVADAPVQNSVDIKAATPRLTSDKEKNKSYKEVHPGQMIQMPTKGNIGILHGEEGEKVNIYDNRSRQMPPSQSTYDYMTGCYTMKQPKECFDVQRIPDEHIQMSVYSNSVQRTNVEINTHPINQQCTESEGEDLIYYTGHEEAVSEDVQHPLLPAVKDYSMGKLSGDFGEFPLKTQSVQSQNEHKSETQSVQSELCKTVRQSLDASNNASCSPPEKYLQSHTKELSKSPDKSVETSEIYPTNTVQSEEPFVPLPTAAVQFKKTFQNLQSTSLRPDKPIKSLATASVQSKDHLEITQTVTAQPVAAGRKLQKATFPFYEATNALPTAICQTEEALKILQLNTEQSKKCCRGSDSTTEQPEEPIGTIKTACVQSQEHFTTLKTDIFQTKKPCKISQSYTVKSEELLKTLQTAAVQCNEPVESKKNTSIRFERPCSHAETSDVPLKKDCEGFIENIYLQGFSGSGSSTIAQSELNRPLQTSMVLLERLKDFHGTALDLSCTKDRETFQPEHCYLQSSTCSTFDELLRTGQTEPTDSEVRHQQCQDVVQPGQIFLTGTTEDQGVGTVNSMLRAPVSFADIYSLKESSTTHSEEVYLSRICDSQWKDSVTAIKVAVEASPVRLALLSEVERSKSVKVGEPITLRCEISDPNAQVTWYKDELKLQEASGQDMLAEACVRTLAIHSALPSDAGIYSCQTSNDAMQFHVDVKALTQNLSPVSEPDPNMTAITGSPIALQCELSEHSGQDSWSKNGEKLLPPSGVDIQSGGSTRSPVAPLAEQAHTTTVCHSVSKDERIWFAEGVKGDKALPVKFCEQEKAERNKSVQEGAPVVLKCQLAHNPSAVVVWYKDGTKLHPQDNVKMQSDSLTRTLLIQSAQHVHAGTYKCSTSDDAITFTVDVQGRSPQIMPITLSEKFKTITLGSPIILQCEVSDPKGQVSWFKDEEELFCRTGLNMKREGNLRKLLIHSAKASDSGLYRCKLLDDVVTFNVDIEETPPPPVRLPSSPEVARNERVETGCPIIPPCDVSEPNSKVYWLKDGEQPTSISEHEVPKREGPREVVIPSAEVRHCGVYRNRAADNLIEIKVDVAALPEVEMSSCTGAGEPVKQQNKLSQTCGYEDDVKVPAEPRENSNTESFKRTLPPASSSAAHSRKNDSDYTDVHDEVKAPPVTFVNVKESDLYHSVVEQEELVLTCEVSRDDGDVVWYKDGVEMQPNSHVTMQAEGNKRNVTIPSAQLLDAGTYTCRAGENILYFKVNIREPPVMIIHPKEDVHLDRHVPEEIILSCELSRPNGAVSWFKDGQKLQESENIKLKVEGPYRRLKIISGGVEDSGEYVCDTADDSKFFQLSITEPPVQIVSPSQSQMELCQQTSERMVLSCEISRPNALVRWYRDGLEVEENDNLILEVDGVYRRLIIPETTVRDSAEYVCDTADDSVTFFVNIAEPPVRFVRPRKMACRVEKRAGETLVLDCEVSRPNADVTWKKNGEEVEDCRNVTIFDDGVMRQLTIHSLTLEDAGQYVCDAKDDVMDFSVNVQDLPVKIVGKTDAKTQKQFLVSDDIILVCELSRSNAPVRWYKDDHLIGDSERHCVEEQGVFRSLVVLNASLTDSGEYTCDAGDDMMLFHITVAEPPVEIIGNSGHPEHHMLVAGDDLILECEVSRPNAAVHWLRNGEELKPDSRVKIDSYDVVRKLVIYGLQPSDSGKYICDAINDKLITIVEVQEPPVKFVNKIENNIISAFESESVTLRAVVSCDRANVRWLKGGQLLNQDNIHISSEGNTHRLTINPLQLSDSGDYVCDVNTDEMSFSLLVKEMKVRFLRRMESVACPKGSRLTLLCEVNKPKGDVQWLKDGAEVAPSRRHTIRAQGRERSFTIHQLTEEDAGEYVCESTDDRTCATVTVETPRLVEFVAELRSITVCEGEDAVFKCVVSPADTKVVWRLRDKPVALTERAVVSSNGLCHMLCINNCVVSDSGRVTAEAEGTLSEAELQVQEQHVLFTRKMLPVVGEEYGEATLEVEVSVDSEDVQWMRQGVLIHAGAKYALRHEGRQHSLTIHSLALMDRGTYSCETLHDRTQAQLTVEPRKVSIRRGLSDVRTTERETASFEVELSHPNIPGRWTRNGIQLKPTNHFRMSAKGQVHSLTIYNLSVEDTGTFVFSVENQKTSARLVVKEPPVTIFRKLEDQRFPEGATISLECELSRHNVDVKWMKNGQEVKPSRELRIYAMGRKRFLQILKSRVSDSGVYACDAGDITTCCSVEVYETVSNCSLACGNTKAAQHCHLPVQRELLILQGMEDVNIKEDQNAVFVCEISVEDVPGEWYRNGVQIHPTSTIKIRQEGTKHFLLMCNVRAEDSGEIKFVARHVETVAALQIEELPVNIVNPLQDKTALEKSRVIMDCTVSNPRCSIRWYKGPSVVLPSERFEISSEGCYRKLIIQQVALHDEGTYSVQVGEYSCSAKLTVEAQSVLMIRELTDVEVVTSEDACFECELSELVFRPPVWTLNGEALQPGPRVRVEKMGPVHRLTLRKTSPHMDGVVEFSFGTAKSRARLTVISKELLL
ncbi:obscurin isoform X3 [Gouania willdenowi]|uniref:obscurin isoform X3 n=1 Tax=Gouania willdenowi TaxID=441366 RepID=UPI001054E99A|nr:obscurin-like isoform X3 [Gouania willdenowi]